MDVVPAYNLAPLAWLMLFGVLAALLPLFWVWRQQRGAPAGARLRALTLTTLFLTFDLVLFGAFTRLTDSGLGCPDWPGCYGNASPLGAHHEIRAAEQALPSGPVTRGKAWVEMTHRYLASAVGVLIIVLAVAHWIAARRRHVAASPWWATATLLWVCIQGAFGALTVTLKLYPAIVTAHLLGGMALLALLAAQSRAPTDRPLLLTPGLRRGAAVVLGLTFVQVALGGWVSTNYAVLACSDLPTCQGVWWPPMDFARGFTVLRRLGESGEGGYLPFAALTAIHVTHRLGALVLTAAIGGLAWLLIASGDGTKRRFGAALTVLLAAQIASGLGNVAFGWPLATAVVHTAGAAALVTLLVALLARARPAGTLSASAPEIRTLQAAAASRS